MRHLHINGAQHAAEDAERRIVVGEIDVDKRIEEICEGDNHNLCIIKLVTLARALRGERDENKWYRDTLAAKLDAVLEMLGGTWNIPGTEPMLYQRAKAIVEGQDVEDKKTALMRRNSAEGPACCNKPSRPIL